MIEESIKRIVAELMLIYGHRCNKSESLLQMQIWEKALSGLNEAEIRVGYQTLIRTRVKSGMPSPAEFFAALYNDISDDSLMAWNQLFQVIKKFPGRPIAFHDTVLAETCRRLGGLVFLGSLSATDLSFQKRSFMDTYSILAKKGGEYDPHCSGTYECKPIEVQSVAVRKSVTGGAL